MSPTGSKTQLPVMGQVAVASTVWGQVLVGLLKAGGRYGAIREGPRKWQAGLLPTTGSMGAAVSRDLGPDSRLQAAKFYVEAINPTWDLTNQVKHWNMS